MTLPPSARPDHVDNDDFDDDPDVYGGNDNDDDVYDDEADYILVVGMIMMMIFQ